MATVKSINQFIKKTLIKYGIFEQTYFADSKDGIFKENQTDLATMQKVEKILGLTADEIRRKDVKAANKWAEKFPFFDYYYKFRSANTFSQLDPEQYLMARILGFDTKEGYTPKKKYEKEEVLERLESTLKEINDIIPGTYHKDAEITSFNFEAEDFINFSYTKELLEGFFDVIERHKELFFKCFNEELTEEEIKEYNFLTAALEAKDAGTAGGIIFYNKVRQLLPIMKEEGYKDYAAYVALRGDFQPWRCSDFSDYPELAQKYVNIFPQTKYKMKDFCMNIKNISCWFKWSDDITEYDEMNAEDLFMSLFEKKGNSDDIPDNWTRIYLPKSEDELGEGYEHAKKLGVLAGPSTKGGLQIPRHEWLADSMQRIMCRVSYGIKKEDI